MDRKLRQFLRRQIIPYSKNCLAKIRLHKDYLLKVFGALNKLNMNIAY